MERHYDRDSRQGPGPRQSFARIKGHEDRAVELSNMYAAFAARPPAGTIVGFQPAIHLKRLGKTLSRKSAGDRASRGIPAAAGRIFREECREYGTLVYTISYTVGSEIDWSCRKTLVPRAFDTRDILISQKGATGLKNLLRLRLNTQEGSRFSRSTNPAYRQESGRPHRQDSSPPSAKGLSGRRQRAGP